MPILDKVNAATAQTWNYMKINQIAVEVPEPATVAAAAAEAAKAACEAGDSGACKIVSTVSVPQGAKLSVADALPDGFAAIETGIGEEAAAWIDEAASKVAVVQVPAGAQLGEPIVVDLASGGPVASTAISVGDGASANIVVIADASEDAGGSASDGSGDLSASLVRLVVGADARVEVFEIVALPSDRRHIEGFGIECAERAAVDVRQYSLSAGTSAVGLASNMVGADSRFDLQLHYLGRGEQTIDVNHLVRMRGRNTLARIDESGVLSDSSRKTLRATIDLVRGGKGAKGSEQETVVVTGDDVVNKTLPVILCDEDDVQGDHGATIGSMGAEQLDYMRNRGLSTRQAEELFERAVVDEAVIHAPTKRAHEVATAAALMLFGQDAVDDIADAMAHSWN